MLKRSIKIISASALFLFIAAFNVSAEVNDNIQIKANQKAFASPANLSISENIEKNNIPWEWEALSPAYDYSFVSAGLYDPSYPLEIRINYSSVNNYYKQIFSYDFSSKTWRPLLTKDFPKEKYVSAKTNSISGKLILLANPDILSVGTASWYKYKNGLFAASPDFKKGTVLRVYNLNNNKFVDVTINDFGPERTKHPDRVIDLDYVAFNKIASSKEGIIPIKVEPLKIVNPSTTLTKPQESSTPIISADSAIVISEKDGRILWGKNENSISPLASLTKLVAIRTFLDTKPTLNTVVAYKLQDEKYNYEYCKPWESAKLKVSDGETMTIENLIYSALVGSANNAIETLVRVSGLERNKFIEKMNELAKSFGANNTKFVEPTGLSPDNVSSPYDYGIITKEIFSNPLIQKISTTSRYEFKTVNTKKLHRLSNTNQLLKSAILPIIGSKTGYLEEAGYCLMTRVKAPRENLIIVNFNSKSKAESFSDNEQLIRYGLRLLKKYK